MKTYYVDLGGKRLHRTRATSGESAAVKVLKQKNPKRVPLLLRFREGVRGVWHFWDAREAAKRAGLRYA